MNYFFIRLMRFGLFLFVICNFSFVCTQPKSVTILHTNDMHAAFIPHEAGWIKTSPKPMVGGFRQLAYIVDSIRHAKNATLLLDAGDVMTGTPIAEIDYEEATGGALFEMMNKIGYEAWTFGNHDLDISQDNLKKLTRIAKFPTLSANVVDDESKFSLNNKPYLIFNKSGLRIGIIGIMSKDLFSLTNTNNLKGLKVLSPIETAQKEIDEISSQTDLIIGLTHEGVDEDSILAVSTHGLNVIIGAHSHTRLKSPKLVNGVIICQTGANCENLGELELTVENKKVTSFTGKLIQLWARKDLPENDISKMIDEFKAKIDKEYGEVIGTLANDWKRSSSGESGIGNFIAEAIRDGANAQIGITNTSGIRKDFLAGPITKLDLFEISPFRNFICTYSMSGKELIDFAKRYTQSLANGRASIQLSGIECSYKLINGNPEIVSLQIGSKEVSEKENYLCATSDYVINQGSRYLSFVPAEVTYSSTTIYNVLVEKVRKDKTVGDKSVNHFREVK
jgi:5'-nucleotidase/UDP-sugar diphosphatase